MRCARVQFTTRGPAAQPSEGASASSFLHVRRLPAALSEAVQDEAHAYDARMIDRKELTRQLLEASKLLDVLDDDPFRARAYAQAARGIEAYDADVEALVAEGDLTRIRGIGKGLASELAAAPVDGVLPLLVDLRARVPEGVRDLFRISGLGAGKIRVLWRAGVDSLDALIAGVERGEIQKLKGFGAKSSAGFAEGARFVLASRSLIRRDEAEMVAAAVAADLAEEVPGAVVVPVGDLRRGMEVVELLELVVTGAEGAAVGAFVRDALGGMPASPSAADPSDEPSGDLLVLEGHVADRRVRVVVPRAEAAGAAIVGYTGSPAYVQALQAHAEARDLRLRATGLFRGGERLATPAEADVFAALEVEPPAPELREGADASAVPDLIELHHIRGVVHNHSTWSDAAHSIREMVAAARAAGFAYLAMADHSRSSFYAGGLSEQQVVAQAEEVREIRAELASESSDFSLLHGIEVDIKPDGSLDYDEDVLGLLDYAVVSVHQQFTLSRAEQTARIVAAVQSPYADILGHATGRLLLRRPGYDVDLDAVVDACAATGTVVEINANPRRLDLDWRWARVAKARGCRFSIDPDAHDVRAFDDLRYGVAVARKAGLTPADVVTTAPTGEAFLARLKRPRG